MAAERDFRGRYTSWLKVTLWLVGLMLAFVTGNLSAYVVLSVLYFGSQTVRRVGKRELFRLVSGDDGRE